MLIRLVKWFQGYLFVVLKGYSPERFVNLCRNKQILIWDLRRMDGGYGFFISVKGFKKLLPIVYKTKTVPVIKGRMGLPFYLYRYRRRKVFFASLFLFAALICLCSQYVWNIEVSGQYFHTEEAIVEFLETIGTKTGVRKSRLDCKGVEDAIRKEYPDIGWVSAELRGTKLRIKLTETNMPVPKVDTNEPSHLIASHDGIVTSIVTRHGVPMVREGDVVRKGDVLVSGVIDLLDDAKTVVRRQPVVADADVVMKTYYEYFWEKELQYKEKAYTGRKKKMVGFSIFGKNIFFYNILKKIESFEKYDIIVKELSPKITDNFYLPFAFVDKTYEEYEEMDREYTKAQLRVKANEDFKRYAAKLQGDGIEMLEHFVSIHEGAGDKCTASGKVVVLEKQEEYRRVTESEWSVTKTDEPNGEER